MTGEMLSATGVDVNKVNELKWEGGRLGNFLESNPEMIDQLKNPATRSKLGFRLFSKIHANIAGEPGKESNKLFGLYESADLNTLKSFTFPVEFTSLSSTLRLAHDVLYFGGSRQDQRFYNTVRLFQEELAKSGFLNSPVVKLVKEAFEKTLKDFDSSHNISDRKEFTDLSKQTQWDRDAKALFLIKKYKNVEFDGLDTNLILMAGKALGLATGEFHGVLNKDQEIRNKHISLAKRMVDAFMNRISSQNRFTPKTI